jgi:PAS domain S-box-containing protein
MDHMKEVDGRIMRATPWAVAALTIGIFALDLLTPLGVAVSVLYAIPLLVTFFSTRARGPLYFTAMATALIWVNVLLKPPGLPLHYALFNRALGTMVIWVIAIVLIQFKRTQVALASERVERAHAEGLMIAAREARSYADTAAAGAAASRRAAEEKLRISELRLDSIIESAMDAIITVNQDQHIVLFNRAAEEMFLCPATEAIGQPLDRFLPARFREAHRHHVRAFGESGVTSRRMGQLGTVMGWRANGEEFPIEAAISHITMEGKKFYTVILRDISERQRAEAILRQTEERFRLVALATNDVLWDWDPKTDQHWWSDSAKEKFGYDPEREPSIEAWRCRLHPEDREKVLASLNQALESGQAYWFAEYRFRLTNGSDAVIFDRGHIIRDEAGKPVRMIGAMIDITQRKRAELLLRQSEERYRRLIAVSPYAILVNRGDRVIFANDQAIKLFGAVKAEEILGKSPFELFLPDYHAVIRERIHELLEGSALVPMVEEKIVTLDGTPLDVEVSAARFTDEEGPAILVMLRDISERKRLQERLRKTERIAELGTVASGMAHEIGTPMNVILGRAEYLMERVREEPIRKGLQTIVSQVERITRVMNQLLTFARRKPPERRALNLQQTIEDNLEIFQERLSRNRVKVETSFTASCPCVLADADQMSQVVINLVMNAIHAMPEGGLLRIGLAAVGDDMVQLTVADTGHGISRDAVKRIFEPFFTTKEFGKGTGLGLTVVKDIIEEHQGSITVESEPGKGTTFTILLPACSSS